MCPRQETQAGPRPSVRPAGGSTDAAAFQKKMSFYFFGGVRRLGGGVEGVELIKNAQLS